MPSLQDYLSIIDKQNPVDTAFRGLGQGLGAVSAIRQVQAVNREQALQDAMRADFASLQNDHSPDKLLGMMVKYPEMSAQLKTTIDAMGEKKRQQTASMSIPVYSAALNGRFDLSHKMLSERADAMENSGGNPEEIKAMRNQAQLALDDPASFTTQLGMVTAQSMGANNFANAYGQLEQTREASAVAPVKRATEAALGEKYSAEAYLKQAEAPYAAAKSEADLANAQFEIQNRQQINAINRLNAESARETAKIAREDLGIKLVEHKQKINEQKIAKDMAYDKAMSKFDSNIAMVDSLLKSPALDYKKYPIIGTAQGRDRLKEKAGTAAYTLEQNLGTLKAAKLMEAIQEFKAAGGAGALSDAEGRFLNQTQTALDSGMETDELIKNINKYKQILIKARSWKRDEGKKLRAVGALSKATQPPELRGDPAMIAKYMAMKASR